MLVSLVFETELLLWGPTGPIVVSSLFRSVCVRRTRGLPEAERGARGARSIELL